MRQAQPQTGRTGRDRRWRPADVCQWRKGNGRRRDRRRWYSFRRARHPVRHLAGHFTGRIAYRTTYPAALLGGEKIDDCTKWWGEDRHIVIYYVKPDRSEIYLVTSQPEPEFRIESWSAKGDVRELRKAFAGFHRQVEQVLAACPDVHKWAIVDRNALDRWTERNVTLLGDACHPMTPYMAQGAAMAIEDAAVLSRCLDGVEREGIANAFRRFEATRKARTTAHPADLARQYVAERKDQCGLGLRLRRLDRAAGGVSFLVSFLAALTAVQSGQPLRFSNVIHGVGIEERIEWRGRP